MTLATPGDPDRFSERIPITPTIVIDRDTCEGLSTAVGQAMIYTSLSPQEARAVIVQAVTAAHAGDVITVASVRVAVR